MANFDFVIPLSLQMLEESSSSKQYVVTSVFTAWEITKKIKDVQGILRQDGAEFILKEQCFDTLYSVLVNFASVDEEVQHQSWDLMVKAMGKLVSELGQIIDGDLTGFVKHKWLNIVKMTTFIACKLTEAMENKCNKTSADILVPGRGRKKALKDANQSHCWEEDRNSMLVHLYTLVQHPLQRLWNPPVVEDDFVILIGDCCYKMLESSNMALVRTKDTRTSLFQIIGTLVKKFNHGMGCSLKILQLLRQYEHMVSPAAQGVILLIQAFGDKFVLTEIIKEISRGAGNDMAKDTSGLRNFTQFLIEVSSTYPQMIVPSLSLLISFLDEEIYSLRNCVLSIMGSVVLNLLNGDSLDLKSKDLRDQCLEHLEDHIHDVHAFIRSKVLQIWNDLIREKAVPLSRQHHILKLVLGRLWDKSSLVRKNAIQLLTAFVNSNPFAAKLPLEELESQCALEVKKLEELSPGIDVDSVGKEEVSADENITPRAMWIAMIPDVIKAVQEVLEEDKMECEEDEDTPEEETSLSRSLKEVAESLHSNKFYRAVRLLQDAFEKFTGAEVLIYNPEEHSSKQFEEIAEEELTHVQINFLVVLERIFLSAKEMEKNESSSEEDSSEKNEELKSEINKQKTLVAYLKDSVKFAKLIQQGLPIMCQLLGSKHVSDVMEAISFFVTAFEFGVLDAMTGVRKMLMLVWSKEQEVKAAVVEAYRRLYIKSNTHNERTQALQIVENLSSLIVGATMGERTSLEEIVSQFVSSGDITKQCITLLWERFTKTLPDTTDEEAHTALILLAMCANAEQSIILSNFDVLTTSGLGERGEKDFALVKETCHALLRVAVFKPKTDAPTAPNRLDRDHEIFERLSTILIQGLANLQDRQYSPMAVKAVSTIYALAEHPDLICGEILQKMYQVLENSSDGKNGSSLDSPSNESTIDVSTGVLTRFCVMLGHVAVCQLVHLDIYVFSELKRRNNLKDEMEIEKKRKRKSKNTKKSPPSSASDMSKGSQETDPDEEMGLIGAVADDMEAEYIRYVCETEIISNDNLLGIIKPMVWTLCTNPDKYKNTELQAASSLTLAKYMMVSSTTCEDNLQLLFTILEKSKEDVVRANLVIALGDLYFRFPNELEPWTPRFYARLRDSSSKVRQNTLTILTHLVLNDMVKVKRHISDIAFCICDEDPHISGLAGLFFHELARKGNTLYNVLPDMISRLSDPDVGVEEEFFRKIIGEVLALIQKDKHWENLVEKLCHRFQATINVRQWRDIAYCLSQLQFNEKSIKKLSENFACYADKLHEPEVYDLFMEIVSNVQKTIKPEVKLMVEELEKRIVESHEKGVEDENIAKKAVHAKLKVTNSKTAKKTATSRRGKKSKSSSSESESEGEDTRQQLHPVHRSNKENLRRSSRPSHPSAKKLQQHSDDSEEEEEEDKESPSDANEENQNNKATPRHPLIVSNSQPSRRSRRNHTQKYITSGKSKV